MTRLPLILALTGLPLAAVPMFGARITGGGSVTSSGMPDPYVPVDGTMNVTGAISASSSVTGSSLITTNTITSTASTRLLLDPADTFGVDIETSGSKVACSATNAGSLFYENTAGDTIPSAIYLCGETGTANGYGWQPVTIGVETDYLAADFVATDTTPLDVTGISLAMEVNDTYAVRCEMRAFTALASASVEPGLDVPAGAAVSASCSGTRSDLAVIGASFATDDGRCAFTSSLVSPGGSFTIDATVVMSSTAGDTKLRLRSETTDDVTVAAGAKCEAKKIVDA